MTATNNPSVFYHVIFNRRVASSTLRYLIQHKSEEALQHNRKSSRVLPRLVHLLLAFANPKYVCMSVFEEVRQVDS